MMELVKKAKEQEGRCVYIIRHGQTLLNAEDKIRGWLDIPLDAEGEMQARKLGAALLKQNIGLDGLITSDLQRAIQTSLLVSEISSIPLIGTTRALRPWDVGTYSGKDGATAHKIMMDKAEHAPDEAVGGGESFNQFRRRILGGIISLLNCHRGMRLGLVSHSRGERVLHAWIKAGCPEDLSIDLHEFGARGEETATAQELYVDCPLVFTE